MAPTASQVADAIAGRFGPVPVRWRFDWRSHDYDFLGDVTPAVMWPEGGDGPGISPPVLELDNDRAVTRTCQLTLDPALLPGGFDAAADDVAIVEERLILGEWVEFPQGLYHLDVARERYAEGRDLIEARGSDLTLNHLVNATTQTPYTVAAATNYITAAETILAARGLEHSIGAVGSVTPYAHTWGPGVSWWEVLADLMAGINRYPVWPDALGVFTTRERIDPSTETANITYQDTAEPRMLRAASPFAKATDAGRYPNKAVVVIDDPRHSDIGFELRENTDAGSPVSTANQDENLVKINGGTRPSTKAILDAATAGAIGEFVLRDAASRALTADFETFADPRIGAREAFTIDIDGVESSTLWISRSWSRRLAPGAPMRHRISRADSVTIVEP